MKKIIPLLILLFTSSIASAQLFKGRNTTLDKPEYQIGAVTEVNGKVVFEENITATSMGSLHLDENLKLGEYRELTEEELSHLC